MTYKHTKTACYLGYITQAVVNNLLPLLFVTLNKNFGLSLSLLGSLSVVNFVIQIATDLAAAKVIKKFGMRASIVTAFIMNTAGLLMMGLLPLCMSDTFLALVIAVSVNAVGGGLIEVLISPIIEAVPSDNKASQMGLLHSFYSWGQVLVILLSTLFFVTAGIRRWYVLPVIWSCLPFVNIFLFMKVPIGELVEEGSEMSLKGLLKSGILWVMFLLMICAGSSEMAVSQWSSLLAELGLGVSKTVGDIMGPCLFALLMGGSRLLFGIKGSGENLKRFMTICALGCAGSYFLIVFSPFKLLSLVGCGLTGFFVGVMWPCTFSLSSRCLPAGGTLMFTLLAFAGDIGCAFGAGMVGYISDSIKNSGKSFLSKILDFSDSTQAGLKTGIFIMALFPIIMLAALLALRKRKK